jgi:hypothetical protein
MNLEHNARPESYEVLKNNEDTPKPHRSCLKGNQWPNLGYLDITIMIAKEYSWTKMKICDSTLI